MTNAVAGIDITLQKLVAKQEKRFESKFAIFVQERSNELSHLVEQLNEKSSNRTLKDLKIGELQTIIKKLRDEAILAEDINTEKRDDVR